MKKLPVTVSPVVEAFCRLELPVAVKRVAVVVAKVEMPVTPRVPATERRKPGVEEAMPMFPFCSIEKRDVPVEDAMVNGFTPASPCRNTEEVVVVVPVRSPPMIDIPPW